METIGQAPCRVRFEVADVVPSTKLLPEISVRAALERTTRRLALVCANADGKVLEQGDFHPLMAAAFLAFKQHYPLVLS